MLIVALIIIALLAKFVFWFRAYAVFNLVLMGGGMFIAGLIGDSFWILPGAAMLGTGILIMFVTARAAEPSRRPAYMGALFLYGMFLFLRVMMIGLIITIPFVKALSAMSGEWREVALVNGAKVTINTSTMQDAMGNKYVQYEDDGL